MQHPPLQGRTFDRVGISDFTSLDAGVPLRDVQIAARHADPRTTTIYDRRRENFDRHAAYVVVAFVAGG
jgi:integrase/recombinase XerD